MVRAYITAVLVIFLASHADSACITKFLDIFKAEQPLTLPANTVTVRTYTLCPNTTFSPGTANQDTGVISNGDFPLVCRRNCHIKCGTDGSSSNNCKIQGSGTYGIFMAPYLVFDDAPTDASNIVIQGITLELWKKEDQIPVISASPSGNITYVDCVFKENRADPLFVLDEFLLSSSTSGRNRHLEMKMTRGFKYPIERSASGPRVSHMGHQKDKPIHVETERGDRSLQTTKAPFRVNFQRCRFEASDCDLMMLAFLSIHAYSEVLTTFCLAQRPSCQTENTRWIVADKVPCCQSFQFFRSSRVIRCNLLPEYFRQQLLQRYWPRHCK